MTGNAGPSPGLVNEPMSRAAGPPDQYPTLCSGKLNEGPASVVLGASLGARRNADKTITIKRFYTDDSRARPVPAGKGGWQALIRLPALLPLLLLLLHLHLYLFLHLLSSLYLLLLFLPPPPLPPPPPLIAPSLTPRLPSTPLPLPPPLLLLQQQQQPCFPTTTLTGQDKVENNVSVGSLRHRGNTCVRGSPATLQLQCGTTTQCYRHRIITVGTTGVWVVGRSLTRRVSSGPPCSSNRLRLQWNFPV